MTFAFFAASSSFIVSMFPSRAAQNRALFGPTGESFAMRDEALGDATRDGARRRERVASESRQIPTAGVFVRCLLAVRPGSRCSTRRHAVRMRATGFNASVSFL